MGVTPAQTPWERARAVYADGKSPRSFEHDLVLHFEHGFVFATPQYFVMGRPVKSSAPTGEILNPEITWPRDECDCWHVWLCIAPDMLTVMRLMPWHLPKVSFERSHELRLLEMERIKQFNERIQTHG